MYMYYYNFLLCIVFIYCGIDFIIQPVGSTIGENVDDEYLTFPQFCRKYGYPYETHTIKTEDGYLLTSFRIPYGKKGPGNGNQRKKVVLLQHGFMASSDCFILNTPEKNLAYLLADANYDVWINNFRGVPYSKRHSKLDPYKPEYWKFSFHEMGVYDIPAVINYILKKTNEQQLSYVGHSMGTTALWIALSEHPELNSKIKVMIALAPVAFLSNARSPVFRTMAPLLKVVPTSLYVNFLSFDGDTHGEFNLRGRLLQFIQTLACRLQIPEELVCDTAYNLVFGFDRVQFNETQQPVYKNHFPLSQSAQTFVHFAQLVNSGRFCKFDYGIIQNLINYGQMRPPDYDLSKITAKMVLFWAENDWLADPEDVTKLARKLPNVVDIHKVQWEKFNHGDYMTAIDINPLVHYPIMRILARY